MQFERSQPAAGARARASKRTLDRVHEHGDSTILDYDTSSDVRIELSLPAAALCCGAEMEELQGSGRRQNRTQERTGVGSQNHQNQGQGDTRNSTLSLICSDALPGPIVPPGNHLSLEIAGSRAQSDAGRPLRRTLKLEAVGP